MSNVKLSKIGSDRLDSIKPELKAVVIKAFENMPFDITVLEGIRTLERQKELVAKGASQILKSKHLTGDAVDLAPYPIDWNNKERFVEMSTYVLAAAKELGVKVRWGGDWNRNGEWKDEKFLDCPHFELD